LEEIFKKSIKYSELKSELSRINYEENPLKMGNNTFRLKYTYYRFFIEYLINTYGLSEFQDYLKKYMNNPKDYKNIFSVVYGQGMDDILEKFSEYMEP
jgi:hypothetical protein